jgi:hypothetical protein
LYQLGNHFGDGQIGKDAAKEPRLNKLPVLKVIEKGEKTL